MFSPVQSREQTAGAEEDGALGQHGAPLVHPVQVPSGHVCHTDRSRRTIHELIAVPVKQHQLVWKRPETHGVVVLGTESGHSLAHFVVETSNTLMCPVFAQCWQDVSEGIRPVRQSRL